MTVPAECTIDDFARVRAIYETHQTQWDAYSHRKPQSVHSMQQYLLTPSQESWSSVLDQLRRHRAIWVTSSFRSCLDADRPPELEIEDQIRDFEQNKRKLSEKEVPRLGALIQIAAIMGGPFRPNWSRDLLVEDNDTDKSRNFTNCRWGQPFFLGGTTTTLLKKVYVGPSLKSSAQIFLY